MADCGVGIGDLAIIYWKDAASYGGWTDKEHRVKMINCRSVGWIAGLPSGENNDYYVIGDENDNDNIGRTITIPKKWVQNIDIILKAEGENVKKKQAAAKPKKAQKKPKKSVKK